MSTFLDLATDAMIRLGELAAGETLSSSDATYCQGVAEAMLDAWSIERLMIYNVSSITEALTASQQDYTIGPSGATFTAPRPTLIQSAAIVIPGTTIREPMSILSSKKWFAIKEKGLTGVLPTGIYLDQNFPNAGFHVSPIPSGTPTIEFYYWAALSSFPLLTTTFSWPPGYYNAMVMNLAIFLSSAYNKPLDQTLAASAVRAMESLKAFNSQILTDSLGPETTLEAPTIGRPILPAPQQGQPQ
jgi:hypothetical protein